MENTRSNIDEAQPQIFFQLYSRGHFVAGEQDLNPCHLMDINIKCGLGGQLSDSNFLGRLEHY